MNLALAPYPDQKATWPKAGRHIMAQYDDEGIVVYQAYRPDIGHFAAEHGYFGGAFSYERMSWIKPNFLWMVYRSGWGTKPNQEVTLAVRLRRSFFEALLAESVESSYRGAPFASKQAWQAALKGSAVRLQWDPDHHPSGAKLERRALQLGLRGATLRRYGRDEILSVTDISAFVAEQRVHVQAGHLGELSVPVERPFVPADVATRMRLRLDSPAGS
ncbi:MAG: DUF4291 domain-containing protein [Bacteroidota bacterium]